MNNPSVNRYFTDKAMDCMDHALGRPADPLLPTYRNHYAIDASCTQAAAFAASPHWQKMGERDGMAFFSVSQVGKEALSQFLLALERPWKRFEIWFEGYPSVIAAQSRAKARYDAFLRVSDFRCDLTFRDFIKTSAVRSL
ncbi:hypothetical protein ACO34A_03475 [Rhizobium sp. ACO-34A]|nr:hypothetical protein ACO34A_03475 [Rhizobium sp. ACO-34A]